MIFSTDLFNEQKKNKSKLIEKIVIKIKKKYT